jgi:hypothetical protein
MQDKVIVPLREVEVARLVKFIRREEDNEHVAQLYADISSEFSRIARHMGKVGFILSDEWKSSDHLVLSVKEYKARLLAINIRATGNPDNQSVDVSHSVLRRRETKPVSFSLPDQFAEAKAQVMSDLFEAFPQNRLMVKVSPTESAPMFENPADKPLLPTWDEGVMKDRAYAEAERVGLDNKVTLSPWAVDNVRVRSFSR